MSSEADRPVPRQRTQDLVVRALADGTLVFDRRTSTAHYLPDEVTRVRDACTGHTALAEIAAAAGVSEQVAASAADQLTALDLLEAPAGVNRRRFLRRAGVAGAGALMIPVIESVVAPTAAMAQSKPGTLDFSAVCGVGGVAGQMGWVASFRANSGWDASTQYLVTVEGQGGQPTSSAGLATGTSGAGTTDPNGTAIGSPGAFPNPGTPVTVTVTNTRSNENFTFEEVLTTAAGNGCPLPQGLFAYVANNSANTVSVVNTATSTTTAALIGFTSPVGVAVAPDGSRVYVTNRANAGFVRVINTADNSMSNISLSASGNYTNPEGIAVTPDGSRVYVANNSANNVSVIDTSSASVIATVPIASPGNLPVSVAIAGGYVYVGNTSGHVTVISTATNTVATTITVGNNLLGIAAAPDGSRVYVTNNTSTGSVAVIDTASNTVVTNVPATGGQLRGIAVTPDGSRVYVAAQNNGNVTVINTADNTVLTTIALGSVTPYGVAVAPDGSSVYVTANSPNNVAVINTADNSVNPTRIPVGSGPQGIAIGP